MTCKEGWLKFKNLAYSKGYTRKVVGDYSFQKPGDAQAPIIKLWGMKGGRLQIFETGVGRYEAV